MELHKLGVKIFAEEAESINLLDFIPVFHRWIQMRALDGLLIDVADYSHAHAGPGILLIAHEGNYGFDETNNQRGMVYYSKRSMQGTLSERITDVCRRTLQACQLLREESALAGLKFCGNAFQVFANDRLLAPNTDATYQTFEPALTQLLATLYPGSDYRLEQEPDPKERFSITVKTAPAVEIDTLLQRLA